MGRLQIIDERSLNRLHRLGRLQAALLVLSSLAAGYWLAQSDRGVAYASPSVVTVADPAARALQPAAPWCQSSGTLRMACQLSLPPRS